MHTSWKCLSVLEIVHPPGLLLIGSLRVVAMIEEIGGKIYPMSQHPFSTQYHCGALLAERRLKKLLEGLRRDAMRQHRRGEPAQR
jgi:hypothetical protein